MPRLYCWIFLGSLVVLAGCGGNNNKASNVGNNTIAGAASNVQAMTAGNSSNPGNIVNGAFTSVTVCTPGTTTCATISGVLVDTGSTGLRVLASQLPSGFTLPGQTDSSGNTIVECAQFADGVTWGPVENADVKLSSEQAGNIPIQVIADPNFSTLPTNCSNMGPNETDAASLGANGILGIGNFLQDCGPGCTAAGTNPGFYYSCPAGGCTTSAQSITESLNLQLQHPVAHFATDNDGVILELPAVTSPTGALSLNGSLVFGIGTQSNNGLAGASVLTLDGNGDFITTFQGNSFNGSFVDSGSNGLFFLDSTTTGMPMCPTNTSFYCPSGTKNFAATNVGANNVSTGINFSVTNGDQLLATPNFLFNNLGAPNPGAFDWGLPFFFGRNIFIAIEGQSTPGGTGPYVAY